MITKHICAGSQVWAIPFSVKRLYNFGVAVLEAHARSHGRNACFGAVVGVKDGEASMTLRTEQCDFRLVSEAGRALAQGDDSAVLLRFTRQTLACPRLRLCPYGDYCTIFAASLLAEHGKTHADDPIPLD